MFCSDEFEHYSKIRQEKTRVSLGRTNWYYKKEKERELSGYFKENWLVMKISQIQFKVPFK